MKVLQINTTVNFSSIGRIAEDIGKVLMKNGHQSYIAFGRGNRPSASELIRIGNKVDVYLHVLQTRLFDNHGIASVSATKKLIQEIEKINPDVIGLHNLTGYYINIEILFDYLNARQIPVLWTLFDCWAITGHCTYFDVIGCEKWKIQCNHCPNLNDYPLTWCDNSKRNFRIKKELFTKNKNLHLLVNSNWLEAYVKQSFLKDIPVHVTPSAIDIEVFKCQESNILNEYGLNGKKVLLGCASDWVERKGLKDLVQLSQIVGNEYRVVVIGVTKKQQANLPESVTGIQRTENINQLAAWYSSAFAFVNPTYQDNFPTTNLEALSCGTPVVTYNTGGSPEAIDQHTGRVVEKGDVQGLASAIDDLSLVDRNVLRQNCRDRAEKLYDKNKQFMEYLNIFQFLAEKAR